MNKKFYITSTLPYLNAPPHIGFALEMIEADVIARYHVQRGEEVIFNTGTDEHGTKIYQKAQELNEDLQSYVDRYAAIFQDLKSALNLSYTHFIRTTELHHKQAAQEFWRRCRENGYIDKRFYKSKYCVGCELEKTDSDLEDGKCPIHPNLTVQINEEENYFFKFSAFEKQLLELYRERPDFVLPESRLNEIRSFVEGGLKDFSISRLKSKMPWGVPVPDDDEHVMYVWFDALVNYISTLGWPDEVTSDMRQATKFDDFWPGVQIAGKDNLRQQSAMWQAMLIAAGLPFSKQILIHGFINHDGQKMSKSLGNVVDPFAVIKKYGTDPVRYFLLREIPSTDDGDYSDKKLEDRYNGDLANNLGNLVSRAAKLIEKKFDSSLHREPAQVQTAVAEKIVKAEKDVETFVTAFRLHEALGSVFELLSFANEYINDRTPWAEHHAEHINETMINVAEIIVRATSLLWPFLPETAEKIFGILGLDANTREWQKITITETKPLFPRFQK